MLSRSLRPFGFNTWEKEDWEAYRARLSLPNDEATLEFYRQVVYDHFDHFNEHYPDFDLDAYQFSIEHMTAQEAFDRIRFFLNKPMTEWETQYDHFKERNQDYPIYQSMSKFLTPPFPPILVEATLLVDEDWRVYGRDIHLIEGTHRVSYLQRMLELGEISPDSSHKFVVLRPRSSAIV